MTLYRTAAGLGRALGVEERARRLAGSCYAVATDHPWFHLTYDDGPHPEVTPRVLATLAELEATATFFVVSERARQHPEIVAAMVEAGHEVGLHSRTHQRLTKASWSELRDEIHRARGELETVTGRPVRWFRPPWGAQNLRSLAMTRRAGMRTLLWSVDSHDWKGIPGEGPLLTPADELRPGSVLLLHDIPARSSHQQDLDDGLLPKEELTRAYIEGADRLGLAPVGVDQLFESGTALRRAKLG